MFIYRMLVFLSSAPLFLGIYILFRKTNEDIKPRIEDALESKGVFIMALEDGNGMVMPVTPMYGNAYNNGGFGGFGNDGFSYLIILFLFAMFGGWGNGFGNNGAGNGCSFPWMLANNTDNLVTAGFNQSATAGALSGIQSAITNGFGNAEVSRCNAQANILQTLNANQNATTASMNNIASNLQNCCCENRLGLANLTATVQSENCADRAAVSDGIRDLLANQTANTQRILDQLCNDKIDAKNEKIADLERQLTMANLAASQTAQTGRILADNAAQTLALEQYLNPVPVPAYVVQNPNCCNQGGCGCGSGSTF
jgi:hypothetical protein